MKEYTEKIHRKRLVKMLEEEKPCNCCPAGKDFTKGTTFSGLWSNVPCSICDHFVNSEGCPCFHYGHNKAIELTIAALKKKGDL